jgi:hypothetical protein
VTGQRHRVSVIPMPEAYQDMKHATQWRDVFIDLVEAPARLSDFSVIAAPVLSPGSSFCRHLDGVTTLLTVDIRRMGKASNSTTHFYDRGILIWTT